MANTTTKRTSDLSFENVLRKSANEADGSLTVNGFLAGKIGHRVEMTIGTTNVANDTEQYDFYDVAVLLYSIEVIYTDATRETLMSAERIA